MKEYYKNLPDYMPSAELEPAFRRFLNEVATKKYDLLEALESLLELADRQWHTYGLLDDTIKSKIEAWLIGVNDITSTEVVEYSTSILGRIGLERMYSIMKDSLSGNIKNEIRLIIQETIDELDDHVSDPYFGMR